MKRTLLSFMVLSLAGCGLSGRLMETAADSAVRDAVSGLESDYAFCRPEKFFERIDAARFAAFPAFKARVEPMLKKHPMIPLQIFIDSTSWNGRDVVAKTHWNRKTPNAEGGRTPEEGTAELEFHSTGAETLRLTAIRGASPF